MSGTESDLHDYIILRDLQNLVDVKRSVFKLRRVRPRECCLHGRSINWQGFFFADITLAELYLTSIRAGAMSGLGRSST